MSMKKILMAAVAVSVISASAASAATISTTSKIGTAAGYASGGATIANSVSGYEPYSLANEVTLTAASKVYTILDVAPSSGTAIGAGQYLVTYTVSGGTFDNAVGATTDLTPAFTGTGTVNSVSVNSPTTYSFVVTVNAASFVTGLTLKVPVLLGTARAPVVVSGSITTLAGAVAVDGGAIPAVTVVDYRNGLTFGATPASPVLSLAAGFKAFLNPVLASPANADVLTRQIGTAVGFAKTSSLTVGSDKVYSDTLATEMATTVITSAVLTVAGDLSALDAKIADAAGTAGVLGADVIATAPGVITTPAASLQLGYLQGKTASISLAEKATALAASAGSYSITPVVAVSAGLTAPTFASTALGSVSLEGTNFIASWVGDNSNGINYSIRLGNKSASAISSVTVALLNPYTTGTSGSVASTATCSVGPLPASGELVITSATLTGCFGAFKRSDVRITIQGLSSVLTAKMRTVAAGVVTEQTLGNGVVDAAN